MAYHLHEATEDPNFRTLMGKNGFKVKFGTHFEKLSGKNI
jgi:hypothetical protein